MNSGSVWVNDERKHLHEKIKELEVRVAELEAENKGLKEFKHACTKPKKAANEEA